MLPHPVEHGAFDEAGQGCDFVRVHRGVRRGCDQFTGKAFGRESTPQWIHETGLIGANGSRKIGSNVLQYLVQTGPDQREFKVSGFAKAGGRQAVTNPPVLRGFKVGQNLGQNGLEETLALPVHAPSGP